MSTDTPFPSAAPDFSEPLELLRACHERIFQHCDLLERLAQHLADSGPDQEAREAAAKIHRYFSTAARHHHADEEEDLFPRLARRSRKLADVIHHLQQEHEQLDAMWRELEPLLARPAAIEDTAAFIEQARQLAQTYREHARRENEEVLEVARHTLDNDELRQIGRKMAERRGVAQHLTV